MSLRSGTLYAGKLFNGALFSGEQTVVTATVGVKHYAKKKYEDDLDNFLLPWEIKDKNKTVVVEKQKTGKFAKKQFIVHNTLEAEYITELKTEQKRKRRKKAITMLLESL